MILSNLHFIDYIWKQPFIGLWPTQYFEQAMISHVQKICSENFRKISQESNRVPLLSKVICFTKRNPTQEFPCEFFEIFLKVFHKGISGRLLLYVQCDLYFIIMLNKETHCNVATSLLKFLHNMPKRQSASRFLSKRVLSLK